jgi:hypothetical protein
LLPAKCLVAVPAVLAVALVGGTILEVLVQPGLGWALAALALLALYAITLAVVMVGVGAMFPNLTWDDPRRMATPAAGLFGLLVELSVTVVLFATAALPLALGQLLGLPDVLMFLVAFAATAATGAGMSALALGIARERLDSMDLALDASPGLG